MVPTFLCIIRYNLLSVAKHFEGHGAVGGTLPPGRGGNTGTDHLPTPLAGVACLGGRRGLNP